jgi:hypothetical protein
MAERSKALGSKVHTFDHLTRPADCIFLHVISNVLPWKCTIMIHKCGTGGYLSDPSP